jgi:hypothetical protein
MQWPAVISGAAAADNGGWGVDGRSLGRIACSVKDLAAQAIFQKQLEVREFERGVIESHDDVAGCAAGSGIEQYRNEEPL